MPVKLGGRPAKPLPPAKELVTKRIRRLVDLTHDGNVHEAAKASQIPSATLRALYTGRNTNPSAKTLRRLGEAYQIPPGWFMDPDLPERLPLIGLGFVVSDSPDLDPDSIRRMFMFPWASWPLPEVYRRLKDYLLGLESGPDRPIIGSLREDDPHERRQLEAAIGLFLIAPLDEARVVAGELSPDPAQRGVKEQLHDRDVVVLRKLGQFWQAALERIL